MPTKQIKQIVKKAMKLNDKAFIAAVGCYAIKTRGISCCWCRFSSWATEKFKITDYINDLSKMTLGEVHSCEISEADFTWEVTDWR
jgi:threonylcarbamoyladenosine tRNA methylthiotransferase MtaB